MRSSTTSRRDVSIHFLECHVIFVLSRSHCEPDRRRRATNEGRSRVVLPRSHFAAAGAQFTRESRSAANRRAHRRRPGPLLRGVKFFGPSDPRVARFAFRDGSRISLFHGCVGKRRRAVIVFYYSDVGRILSGRREHVGVGERLTAGSGESADSRRDVLRVRCGSSRTLSKELIMKIVRTGTGSRGIGVEIRESFRARN